MTLPSPPPNPAPAPRRRRWWRVLLLVFLVALAAVGWHRYTGWRAERQLRAVGFYTESVTPVIDGPDDGLASRVWETAHRDWRQLFRAETWATYPTMWKLDPASAARLRNLDALAPALRRVNPEFLILEGCHSLENVDGLKRLTALGQLELDDCTALKNFGIIPLANVESEPH